MLDVGHGSCTIISDSSEVVVIDAGPGAPILEYLRSEGILHINLVVISHADRDHIGGLVAMLDAGIRIDEIRLNPDSLKRSEMWSALVYSLDALERQGEIATINPVGEGDHFFVGERVRVDVVAPRSRVLNLGAGATDRDGNRFSSNSMSVVALVNVDSKPLMLLPGDLDSVGYQHLADAQLDIRAEYLVLPHHGGLAGTDSQTRKFIADLCSAVDPSFVLVSNGRGGANNPRESVVSQTHATVPSAKIVCTQLSAACHSPISSPARAIPLSVSGAGRAKGLSCAGTIRVATNGDWMEIDSLDVHQDFVSQLEGPQLCRLAARGAPTARVRNS